MATTIIGLSGLQRGIEVAVVGINCESFDVRYFPAFKNKLEGISGEFVAFAIPAKLSREVTLSGEVIGATGVMAATFATAVTTALGNDVTTFGDGTGGLYVDEANESQPRGGWRSLSMKLSSDPLIA